MSPVLALACVLLQDAPKPRAPDAAVYDALIQKTNDLKAFVAEYRLKTSEAKEEQTLRIAYRAPEALRIEFPGKIIAQIHDGVLEVSNPASGGAAMTARVPIGEMFRERRRRLTDSVRAELPALKGDWVADPDCGMTLALTVSPSRTDKTESFQFNAGYDCPHVAMFAWLEQWKARSDVLYEDDGHLVLTTARGSKLRLSTQTGFVERIEKETQEQRGSFELASLDLNPEFDGQAFEMPPSPQGVQDASASTCEQFHDRITQAHRTELHGWVWKHVSEKSLAWDAEARVHVRKIFERIHADGIEGEDASLLARMKDVIEKFGAAWRGDYSRLDGQDAAARGELEANIEMRRKEIVDSLGKRLDSRTAPDFPISRRTVPDDALRDDLKGIEKEAYKAAFAHVLQDPVLETFDDQVSKAKGGG